MRRAALLMVPLLALGACGGDDDGSTAPAADSSAYVAEVQQLTEAALLSRDDEWGHHADEMEELVAALDRIVPPASFRSAHEEIVAAALDVADQARKLADGPHPIDAIVELGQADEHLEQLVDDLDPGS